jgi:hypothetical protein
MAFGRKKRPSQPEGGQAPTSPTELGVVDEDEDIIELVDIIEIPGDQRAGTDSLGLPEANYYDEYPPVEPTSFDVSHQDDAEILEDDTVEVLEDADGQADERLFADPDDESMDLTPGEPRTSAGMGDLEGEEVAIRDEFDAEELREEDDTDKLIAEIMASDHQVDAAEGGVVVEEYAVDDRDSPLFQQDVEPFRDGGDQDEMLDFGVLEAEPEALGAEDDLARLFEPALAEDMTTETEASADAAVPLVEALTTAEADDLVEESVAVPESARVHDVQEIHAAEPLPEAQQLHDVALVEPEAQVFLDPNGEPPEVVATGFEEDAAHLSEGSPTAGADQVAPPIAQVPLISTLPDMMPSIEPLFSIVATRPVSSIAMMLEEEILFSYRLAEDMPQTDNRSGPSGDDAGELHGVLQEPEMAGGITDEPEFSLDTFLPMPEGEDAACTQGMELLDLVARLESKVMSRVPATGESYLAETAREAVKEELEGLRSLIDGIEAAEEWRS